MLPAWLESHPDLYAWVVLPLLIVVARTTDMGLSTLRIAFIAQGRAVLAPLIGFFEALVWLFVIGQILQHLDNPVCILAYATGFALGNLVGLRIERRLAIGLQMVRIVLQGDDEELTKAFRRAGFGYTAVDGEGAAGAVKILFTVVRRRDLARLVALAEGINPRAFYTVEDVRRMEEGILPRPLGGAQGFDWRLWRALRKSR